ncbi:MAG: ATP-binding protein [Nitrososphaeraceae archaeon]
MGHSLVSLRDIEGEGFDFKGPEFSELSNHICAMANTSGGYIVLGIGEDRNVETDHFIGFKKKSFHGTKFNITSGKSTLTLKSLLISY